MSDTPTPVECRRLELEASAAIAHAIMSLDLAADLLVGCDSALLAGLLESRDLVARVYRAAPTRKGRGRT